MHFISCKGTFCKPRLFWRGRRMILLVLIWTKYLLTGKLYLHSSYQWNKWNILNEKDITLIKNRFCGYFLFIWISLRNWMNSSTWVLNVFLFYLQELVRLQPSPFLSCSKWTPTSRNVRPWSWLLLGNWPNRSRR